MTNPIPSSDFLSRLDRVLSPARIDSYKLGGTRKDALSRYLWNTALCEALYPSFQILEVGFRNALHREVAALAGGDWLTKAAFLKPEEVGAVKEAKSALNLRRGFVTEDFLVAELKFGFWTSLLDSRYELMWRKIIAGVFPNMPRTDRTRGEASAMMHTVRKLRNSALHHHSIWHWKDLEQQHKQTQRMIGYVCDSLFQLSKELDRFPNVYSSGHKIYLHTVEKLTFSSEPLQKPA